jgi:hypothetical protein
MTKFRRLVIVENAVVASVLVLAILFFPANSNLESTEKLPPGWISPTTYVSHEISITRGQTLEDVFQYPAYELMIILVHLRFVSCKISGYLGIYTNGLFVANFSTTPERIEQGIVAVSCCGVGWVKPRTTNTMTFISHPETGYEGEFTYTIELRKI